MKGDVNESLEGIQAVFLDLDGTIYLGGEMIDGAIEFLERLEKRGIRRYFLTNNSSKSVSQYVEKLRGLGVSASEEEVLLSTHDLIAWLSGEGETETYLVGTASIHLHRGVPLVASHPDIVCPTPDGGLPDSGAYMARFEASTGVKATHVCGKPNKGMILHKIVELGLEPANCAMIGDRLYTDIEMAERAGVHGILVLSGEATRDDVSGSPQSPSLIVESVSYLAQ